jgi:hypothetical protein
MARKSLKPQLNQIRAWVRQGRTDAWIAHQLEIGTAELREFRRQHGLSADDEPDTETDLRDEIEAEIEAARAQEPEPEGEGEEEEDEQEEDEDGEESDGGEAERRPRAGDRGAQRPRAAGAEGEQPRRRRRRSGRGRGRKAAQFEAAFDHGEKEGYGLWFDPAVKDDPTYKESWAGKRAVVVTIERERIVIRRAGEGG